MLNCHQLFLGLKKEGGRVSNLSLTCHSSWDWENDQGETIWLNLVNMQITTLDSIN